MRRMSNKAISKDYVFMSVNIPYRKLKIVFDGTVDGLKKQIEQIDKKIDIEIADSILKCEDGRCNLSNHDFELIDEEIAVPAGLRPGEESNYGLMQKTLKTTVETRWNQGVVDAEKATVMLRNSKTIGKHLQIEKNYNNEMYLFVGGFKRKSKKDILSTIIKKSIINYMIDNGYNSKYGLKTNNHNISKIKCSQLQMYLNGKFDTETLIELILDECNI